MVSSAVVNFQFYFYSLKKHVCVWEFFPYACMEPEKASGASLGQNIVSGAGVTGYSEPPSARKQT